MAGIYIHVPFCKKKCIYCDFYSVGTLEKIQQYPSLIEKELLLRNQFIPDSSIETIYFGGGTPSLLSVNQIGTILNSISKTFTLSVNPEITLEANPDDITEDLVKSYRSVGINRLSIGVQSFNDDELIFLGRRHNAISAEKSIEVAQKKGFDNISIDLIYGIPGSTLASWEKSLQKAFSLGVEHLSCYHLTYEEKTILTKKLRERLFSELDETTSINQFNLLREVASKNNYIHYEVSNFAKEGFYSQHNSAYWKGINYLGLGPAAHSYNGLVREWNPDSYIDWKEGIEKGYPKTQREELNELTQFNEMLLTRLRTIWGIDLIELGKKFNKNLIDQLFSNAKDHLKEKRLVLKNDQLIIPAEFYFISDGIISDLIIVD